MIDPIARIASTARIHPAARIGPRTQIGEFCLIDEDVAIGQDCVIEPYVWIKRWTTLGDRNQISAHTVLGTDPLDKNFRGDRSYLKIGNGNIIREHYTISRGTQPESVTLIGDENFIMTGGHIAHNCHIGHRNVFASCALIAGHVMVGDHAFFSGGVVVHQWSKIGSYAMIGGNTRVNVDLPPYFLYSGFDAEAKGINVVGLKRNGFQPAEIQSIKQGFRVLYRSGLSLSEATKQLSLSPDKYCRHLAEFVADSRRGIARPRALKTTASTDTRSADS
jgi:UDP-N-acetylglucosamine acyltransferase